jgi:hypothetical protein
MIIKAKRIRSLKLHLPGLRIGQQFIFGISNIERFQELLTRIGFTNILDPGESVLPSNIFGSVSRFNAEGGVIRHKNLPKEIVYHQREWHWKEWRGNSSEEKSKLVDVPYKRYQITPVLPPSIELRVAAQKEFEKILISPAMTFDGSNQADLLHTINLLLEIFGECQLFHPNLEAIVSAPVKHLNWTVLPQGRYPWSRIQPQVKESIDRAPKGIQKIIENRLQTVNKYNPDFVAIGRAGFRGYMIFGFSSKNSFVLESIRYGNATYFLGEEWEKLCVLTKAEILSDRLHKERVIHHTGWNKQMHKLLA